MTLLYNLLWPLGLLAFLPGFLLKMFRRGGYGKNFGERLGFYRADVRRWLRGRRPVWIHAVSVGEVMIALKLAQRLHAARPALGFVLTTTTATGYALARRSAPEWLGVLYTPLDFWPVMRRAFEAIDPRQIVLIEAEVWPNLVSHARRRNVPVILANARLSTRSERRFLRFRSLLSPIFRKLSLVCVTEPGDVARWHRLGALPERIRVVGNVKFDTQEAGPRTGEPQRILQQLGIENARPVLLGGSTHRGEEELLAEAFIALREEVARLFLIIAPRHVERVSEVESRLRSRGLRSTRRTRPEAGADVLLIDNTGELPEWYDAATVVFIGKSITAQGGQNPVEAIAAGKPVIFGPHMENFAALAAKLIEHDAALVARDGGELWRQARVLLIDPALREAVAARAREVIAPHRGATARTADLVSAFLSAETAPPLASRASESLPTAAG